MPRAAVKCFPTFPSTCCTSSKALDIVRGLLFRENEQTACEGSSAASAWHGSADRTPECDAGASRAAHSPKNEYKRCSGSAAADPSARRRAELPRRVRGKVGGRARDRCLGVQWTWLPPQSSLPPQKHAYVHDTHIILSLSPVCIDSSLAGVEMCSCWAYLFSTSRSDLRGCGRYAPSSAHFNCNLCVLLL